MRHLASSEAALCVFPGQMPKSTYAKQFGVPPPGPHHRRLDQKLCEHFRCGTQIVTQWCASPPLFIQGVIVGTAKKRSKGTEDTKATKKIAQWTQIRYADGKTERVNVDKLPTWMTPGPHIGDSFQAVIE